VLDIYLNLNEAAEYLSISEEKLRRLIVQGKIRAIHDGNEYLLNKEQFNTHLRQMEKYKELAEEYYNEPIPEDRNIKDED
jgi:excisionase family DNA binding protein